MTLLSRTYRGGAPFHFGRPPEDASSESLVLRPVDFSDVRALLRPPRRIPRPRVAALFVHPPQMDAVVPWALERLA